MRQPFKSGTIACCGAALLAGTLLGVAASSEAFAELAPTTAPTAKSRHAGVTIVSDAREIARGTPFLIALSFELDPEWHIYWRDPGDSGMPPSVVWSLPSGFKASELMFPRPDVLDTPAGRNYVHGGKVALLVEITPPADLAPGTDVPISGALKWLECDDDLCLPAKGNVALTLKSAAAASASSEHAEQFAAWRAKIEEGKSFKASADAPANH